MVDVIEALGDIIGIAFALGLSAYTFKLLGTFKGGMMHDSFRILAAAPLLFAAGETVDVLENLNVVGEPFGIVHYTLEASFLVALFIGIYKLSEVWSVQKKA